MADEWGIGDPAKARSLGSTTIGEERERPLELLWGEHPHSRSDNNLYARDSYGTIFEFDGHRVLIDVTLRSYNYLKESYLSGDEIRRGGRCVLSADREPVFAFFFRDVSWALRHADHLIGVLGEHASGVMNKRERDSLRGRKIYWDRTPAVIERFLAEDGDLVIKAEPGHQFQPSIWAIEGGEADDWNDGDRTTVKDSLLSEKIWWHREAR